MEQEKQEASESISYGAHQMRDGVNLSNQKQTKPVVTASQIMMLKDLEAFLKLPGIFPVTKIAFNYIDYPKTAISFVPNKNALKPRKQKETVESNPVAFELFTEEDEVLRLKRKEKIHDKKMEEISDSLQQAKENLERLCSEVNKAKT